MPLDHPTVTVGQTGLTFAVVDPPLISAELSDAAMGVALGVPVESLWAPASVPLSLTLTVLLTAPGLTRAWLDAPTRADTPERRGHRHGRRAGRHA